MPRSWTHGYHKFLLVHNTSVSIIWLRSVSSFCYLIVHGFIHLSIGQMFHSFSDLTLLIMQRQEELIYIVTYDILFGQVTSSSIFHMEYLPASFEMLG